MFIERSGAKNLLALIPTLTDISPARLMFAYVCIGLYELKKNKNARECKRLIKLGLASLPQDAKVQPNQVVSTLLVLSFDPEKEPMLVVHLQQHHDIAEVLYACSIILADPNQDMSSAKEAHRLACLYPIKIENPQIFSSWFLFAVRHQNIMLLENYSTNSTRPSILARLA